MAEPDSHLQTAVCDSTINIKIKIWQCKIFTNA
jgi:hypothetical protein